jgi:hypothetical protein
MCSDVMISSRLPNTAYLLFGVGRSPLICCAFRMPCLARSEMAWPRDTRSFYAFCLAILKISSSIEIVVRIVFPMLWVIYLY